MFSLNTVQCPLIISTVKMLLACFLAVFFLPSQALRNGSATPVLLWHGVGDDHLQVIKQMIRNHVGEDVYIKSVQLGENSISDTETTIFVHPNTQIKEVCAEIVEDENLKNGFNAIGFSQGSQFL